MRHRVKGRKLGRTASHRRATLNELATQLLRYKKIKTTVAKAKETKKFVEPLITKAKNDNIGSRRHIAKFIKDKEVLKELFGEIVEKIGDRPGGYTRVVKLGHRLGDAAELAIVELVDYNEIHAQKKEAKDKAESKTTKSKKAPKKEEAADADVVEETKEKPKKTTKAKSTGAKKTTTAKKETKSKKSDKEDKGEDK
ncbi:MAG: 50S ribosomal protein L17 [Melioribacteraceae bacterium]|jgi:large subunit ribosomal protein L17|nr:50S ribosomal protein L17 [Melioribacteraceae bacterium]RJP61448.1 MAG: 50S ribosomal protein L17 [Ignavibacteriales bacterium]WKZ68495.1 MAG: 50S ribosomal protein L17 [Melioribacteraceae bacterium]